MANSPPMVALDSLDAEGQGLRVEFSRLEDRYTHTIYRVTGDTVVPLFSSLEGAEEEMFPASPCLFDLHQQQQVLFLTGATSTCHWSLSVEALEGNLKFEVACRLKAQPPWLGSTYKLLRREAKETLQSDSKLTSCKTAQEIRISPATESTLELPKTLQWNYVVQA